MRIRTKVQSIPNNIELFSNQDEDRFYFWVIPYKRSDYVKLSEFLKSEYPNHTIEEILEQTANNPENQIGEGKHKTVYQIPSYPIFVVAKTKDSFPQPPEGRKNYFRELAINGIDITKEDAKLFLEQLKGIEQFPLSSFVDLAQQIKYLADKHIRMDSCNPNNLLVDYKKKKLTHIDLRNQDSFKGMKSPINGMHDMISIVTDAMMQPSFYEKLDEPERKVLKETTESIIKKCKSAAKTAGLEEGLDCIYENYRIENERDMLRHGQCENCIAFYEKFLKMYQDVIFG